MDVMNVCGGYDQHHGSWDPQADQNQRPIINIYVTAPQAAIPQKKMVSCLLATIRPMLSAYHLARVKAIDAHDFSGVIRKVKEEMATRGITHDDNWYDRGILALKQYYAVALLDGQNWHAVSNRVDPFWHAHILHTKQYMEFCNDVVGGYMHHDPLDHSIHEAVGQVDRLYRFTMKIYSELFHDWAIDREFNPKALERDDLICVHFGNSYESAAHALFPIHMDGQITVPLHI